jgi:alpha-D-ribose 1-methylphosphonate 5-phosphate C-P lyase
MSVGIQVTKGQIDNDSSMLARQIDAWAESVTSMQAYLVATPDADLIAMGYTVEDVALLKSAIGDLAHLAQVYYGADEQTPAYDFRTFAKRLMGLNVF